MRSRRLGDPLPHQESIQPPRRRHLALLQVGGCGDGQRAVHHAGHQIACCGCRLYIRQVSRPPLRWVYRTRPILLCSLGSNVLNCGLLSGRTLLSIESEPRAAPCRDLSVEEGSGPTRAVLCVLFEAGWFPLHPSTWKQAGDVGVCWSCTDAEDSAQLVEPLSHDIMSVHWGGAATHCDCARLENGCDLSIVKQHLRFFEKCENQTMYGALMTAATGACWFKARVAGLR